MKSLKIIVSRFSVAAIVKNFVITLFVLGSFSPACCQESVASPAWTLEQCLQYGLSQHPQLRIAESNISAEQEIGRAHV